VNAAPRDRLAPLIGLRFAAAFAIVLFHFGGPLVSGAPDWAERIRTGGHVWVGLFYVLSGYVLARANPDPLGPSERRAFWVARLARLYPAYLLAFALAAPFAIERWADGGPVALAKGAIVATAALLLVHAWAPPLARLWNAPGWSTSVIASFYVVFPFLTARLHRLSRRGLALTAVASWAATILLPLAYLALRPDGAVTSLTWEEPFWLATLKFHPLARAGEFLVGVTLGLLHARGVTLARLGGRAAAIALAAAVALLAWDPFPYVLLHNGILVPLLAIAVIGLARGNGLASRALGSAPMRVLGDASFALYALQEPLWLWARALAAPDATAPASATFVVGFMACAVAVSVGVSHLLERPARRALRTLLGAAPRPAPRAPLPTRAVREPA
jgi:peptidoglycan/LPS O-acetylase OafA/YrhL